ncbi:hypothetical protein [Trichlorobacter ammonificans]|uniref:Uncharacterized protein n=1 Tax=Trichlorobacter ammonificans TaxID=2916410 RepID=A0ABN8HG45_9BACT|nr:hypothetical protein [Trichlorobacter ammonificans]CAH2031759.1 conserved exported protein of unknown function [Trichlorobacter ammonificans]
MCSVLTRACCLLCGLLVSCIAWAADPSFELPLKELKKPSLPPSSKKTAVGSGTKSAAKSSEGARSGRKSRRHRTGKAEAMTAAAPDVPTPAVASAPVPAADVTSTVEEVLLTPGLPCWFAGQVAGVLAAPAPAAPLLRGFKLAPVALPRHEGATVVITCGLPAAEAYTTARLLETRHLNLLNLEGNEAPERVLEQVLDSLGFSYVVEGSAEERQYLVSLDNDPETLLRLVIKP